MYRLFCTQCTSCPPFSELINKDIEGKVCIPYVMYRLFCTQCTRNPPFSELINKDIERKVCACNISGKPTNHSYVPLSVYKDDV